MAKLTFYSVDVFAEENKRGTNSLFFEEDKRSLMGKCSIPPNT